MKRIWIISLIICMLILCVGCSSTQIEKSSTSFSSVSDYSSSSSSSSSSISIPSGNSSSAAAKIEQLTEWVKEGKEKIENLEQESVEIENPVSEEPIQEEYYEAVYVEEYYEPEYTEEYYVEEYYEPVYTDYNTGGYMGYEVPYSPMYNEDGPDYGMPGWHDGHVETYYNASGHYMANEWTLDEEGFYRDDEGRYVIGVSINEINPETGAHYQYGDIVETGKGEAVVYDYGAGVDNVHDFATAW